MKQDKINDWLSEQIVHISKAGAYDAIVPKMAELQEENEKLKARIKELEGIINEWHSKTMANLSGPKVDKFLKDQLTDDEALKAAEAGIPLSTIYPTSSDDLKNINI